MKSAVIPILSLLLAVALMFGGCAQLLPARSTLPAPEAAAPSESSGASTDVSTAPPAESEEQPMLEAYRTVLEDLCYNHTWPEGTDSGFDSTFGSIETNQFALADVDGDGKRELVISFTTAPMAGMELRIYGWADGQVIQKLSAFPSVTLYDNGLVKSLASHNHSMSMEFWPYALYRYDPAANGYQLDAAVSGWEKEYYPRDFEDHPFPDEKAENGMVYRIEQNGAVLTLSPTEFADWERETFRGLELAPDWQSLDPQNISVLSTGLTQDWRRGLTAPESLLWQGDSKNVFVCVEDDRIALYLNSQQKTLLAQAFFPKPLDISQLAEYTCSLEDLTANSTGDLAIHLAFLDGSEANLLWLWDDTVSGYVYNEEMSFYPGESGRGSDE